MFPLQKGRELADALDTRLRVLDGVGHAAHREDPAGLSAAIVDALGR